jgi:hypothetical protein
MSIEDRLRRVLADAVADEPPLQGAPLEAATHRRRGRPVLAGVIAMVLVLAAVVALAAVRGQRERPSARPHQGLEDVHRRNRSPAVSLPTGLSAPTPAKGR